MPTFFRALALPFLFFLLSHAFVEYLSRNVEQRHGYYLWRVNDSLLITSPDRFKPSNRNRLMVLGDSESGEGIDETVLEDSVPGLSIDHMAVDGAIFSDIVLQLEYVERVYGATAMPAQILIGLSPRVVANIITSGDRGRFSAAIAKYSAYEPVGEGASAWELAPKSPLAAFIAWIEFRLYQGERYRSTLKALYLDVAHRGKRANGVPEEFRKAKFRHRAPFTPRQTQKLFSTAKHWRAVHAWNPQTDSERIAREFAAVVAIASRTRTRLFFVVLPEVSLNRQLSLPGAHQSLCETIQSSAPRTPFLDLSSYLPDSDFHDDVHLNDRGAAKLSRRIAQFVKSD